MRPVFLFLLLITLSPLESCIPSLVRCSDILTRSAPKTCSLIVSSTFAPLTASSIVASGFTPDVISSTTFAATVDI